MKSNNLKSVLLCVGVSVVASTLMVSCGDKEGETVNNVPTEMEQEVKPTPLETAVEATQTILSAPQQSAAQAAPVVAAKFTAVEVSEEPRVLKDLSTIKVRPGSDSPEIGQLIYTFANLPEKECGSFWVQGDDGYVDLLAKCSGDHVGGH